MSSPPLPTRPLPALSPPTPGHRLHHRPDTVAGLRSPSARPRPMSVVGCPYYLSPETLRGDYGFPADVFSSGIILCEIIARVSADPDFLPRTGDFGVNFAEFRALCTEPCPADFLAATMAACSVHADVSACVLVACWQGCRGTGHMATNASRTSELTLESRPPQTEATQLPATRGDVTSYISRESSWREPAIRNGSAALQRGPVVLALTLSWFISAARLADSCRHLLILSRPGASPGHPPKRLGWQDLPRRPSGH